MKWKSGFGLVTWVLVVGLVEGLSAGTARAQAGGDASGPGCTLAAQIYTCNWEAFRPALDRAKTVAIETQGVDRFTERQLRELVGKLGKSVASSDEPADLTFLLIPMESTGISIGPAGEPVATLRIYGPGASSSRHLLWVETLIGHPDRPWPALVHELIEQFRDRVNKK